MLDELIDELDRQIDALLSRIEADLRADDTFPTDQLPRALAEVSAKLAAHREVAIARLERSMLHGSQLH